MSGILSDLETNLIDSPDFVRRMQGLLDELDRIQREHFSPISDELTAAIKGAQSRWQSSPRAAGRDAEDETHLAREASISSRSSNRSKRSFRSCGSGTTTGDSSGTCPNFSTIRKRSPV